MTAPNTILIQLATASHLAEKAATDILDLTSSLQTALQHLPEGDLRTQCLEKIAKLFEACTFEDLASQHLKKIERWLQQNAKELAERPVDFALDDDPLLRGPALAGEESLSQSDIDRVLKK